jgi:hypothetical protein
MSKKTWKNYLLSSGIPLEHSVTNILRQLGSPHPAEFIYERINEIGLHTQFSIDISAPFILSERDIWLELLIECKYRHKGIKWVFMPEEYRAILGPDFKDVFIILDELADNHKIDRDVLDGYSKQYKPCGKGIELLKNDFNPKALNQAVNQLKYAFAEKVLYSMIHQVDKLLGESSPIFAFIPIIVTTAELWRVNPDISFEEINKADDPTDIATKEDILFVNNEPDNQLKRHTYDKLFNGFTDEQKLKINKIMENTGWHGLKFYFEVFSSYHPSMFVVINFARFEKTVSNLLSFFNTADILKKK